jgi:hypothetical protein
LVFHTHEEDERIIRGFVHIIKTTLRNEYSFKKFNFGYRAIRSFLHNMNILETCATGGPGWFEAWFYATEEDALELPVPFEYTDLDWDDGVPSYGRTYTVRSHQAWNTLRKLGYAEYSIKKARYLRNERNKAHFQSVFLGSCRPAYELTILASCPSHILDSLMHALFRPSIETEESESEDVDDYV